MPNQAATPTSAPAVWAAPFRFLFEAVIDVFVFGVVAAVAVILSLAVDSLSTYRIDPVIVTGLKGAEYAIFATDLVLFARFLWKSAIRTWEVM